MPKKFLIEFNGKIACIAEHCRDLGINYDTLMSRHQKTGESYIECLEYYKNNGVKKRNLRRKLIENYSVKDYNLYIKWYNAKDRCENPKNPMYYRYGKRGIKVCDRWQVYENFENDLLESFLEHVKEFGLHDTQIERKDYNGNYEPNNVTWATAKEQQNNKSNNVMVTEDLNIAQFAEKYDLNYATVRKKTKEGLTPEDMVNSLKDVWRDRIPTGESLDELSKRIGINVFVIRQRYYNGWDWDRIITEKIAPNILDTPTGETIPQIAKRLGVSRQAIQQRLKKGQSWNKILEDLTKK